jgi:hypothetical protein
MQPENETNKLGVVEGGNTDYIYLYAYMWTAQEKKTKQLT